MRPGYVTNEHSLPWVENMGKTWVIVGTVLAVLSAVIFVAAIAVAWPAMQAGFEAGLNAGRNGTTVVPPAQSSSGGSAFSLLVLLVGVSSLLWMVFDILDRRGNFWWLVLQVPCGCCGASFVSLPIYMLAGRKN